ncbi:hypothetical protein O3M35_003085 [Rhynocoris fuscipes]|uniref:Set2 Rpb1 interacting domain-containing protein n=1 Tax=Rhynocoris fuscipes TaxID=488301 RepID=A0AAW1CQD2_9HEMI
MNSIKQISPLCKKRKLQNGEHENNIIVNGQNGMNIENNNSLVINERISSHNGNFTKHPVVEKPLPKSNIKIGRSLLVNWSYELFVQNTHLENILSKLKPHKRIIVEKRFKDLFGNDIIPENRNTKISNLSEEELNLCRKRIAGIVVGELTPFYVEGKIGSRPVFKNLAKKLTDDIMCTTLTPDPESIRSTVQGMFIGEKHINSLKDAF